MKYENIEPLGNTHILFKDYTGRRAVCPIAGLCCWESKAHDNPMIYIVGRYQATRETFDDVVSYLRER
jgi:hypothetical protein